jgi:hypothetical protein
MYAVAPAAGLTLHIDDYDVVRMASARTRMAVRLGQSLEITDALWEPGPCVVATGEGARTKGARAAVR